MNDVNEKEKKEIVESIQKSFCDWIIQKEKIYGVKIKRDVNIYKIILDNEYIGYFK